MNMNQVIIIFIQPIVMQKYPLTPWHLVIMIMSMHQIMKMSCASYFLHQQHPSSTGTPPEWQDVPPDAILAKVKTLKQEFLESKGLRPFYKSYNSWEKMTADQWDKAAAWF
jgi:hypothetical protein